MYEFIYKLLVTFGFDVSHGNYLGNADTYITYNFYDEDDDDYCDDVNDCEIYYLNVTLWTRNPTKLEKYRDIKDLIKSKDFKSIGSKDRFDDGYQGKSMNFEHKRYL